MVRLLVKSALPKGLSFLMPMAIAGIALVSIMGIQLYAPGGLEVSRVQTAQLDKEAIIAAKQEKEREAARLGLLKKFPTLGYGNLVAGWTFLNFLQYFGDDLAREQTDYELLDNYFEVIVAHDPLWVEMYNFLSTSVSFYQARPDLTVKLIEQGLKSISPEKNPRSWLVWRTKGIDELLLIGDTQAAIKSHEMAAKWAEGTPDQDFAPRLREFAEILRKNPDNKLIRIQSWLMVYSATQDKLVRKRAIQELTKLGVKLEVQKDGELKYTIPDESPKAEIKKK
ncbi:hypothetical protein L2E68_20760 [Planktothrix agardhii 1029]|uniref:hypothetical protein n=2 Tax=Planktothrix agardhii TaxID=1160 RepID=UPI001D0B13D1|nr:hypothetical protein [Planktothrix agardhii]MCB8783397.1 hypothetical protein [Planktothrix agardhii 1808]MCB8765337.1 hypothetical protein [Planktothrix agardhii 1809]MCB8778974.1 hypothetical protein [Planktothrix agardhii 1031]MCF3565580.1 hypothetical protein [Planktothrix agardhii 1807]MCF3591905.1 hypothetical protein [Planktothrix agardhii 1029]